MKQLHLSATAIGDFKACPMRHFLHYIVGIVLAVEKDALRVGTNWHRLQEILGMKPGGKCECGILVEDKIYAPGNCPLCAGIGKLPIDLMDAAVAELEQRYKVCPDSKEPADWETEKIILLYSLSGYRWYWSQQPNDVVMPEVPFKLALLNPNTGEPEPNVMIRGKIDKVINLNGAGALVEHKSTSKAIDPSSDYWGHLNLDTQTTLYLYAAQRLQKAKIIKPVGDKLINTVYYDVWHKPTIRPKKLSQSDSKKFVETGEYCGQEFEVHPVCKADNTGFFTVNGYKGECEPGKKEGTFAISETPEMFGARLLQDITERPEFYFACKELERSSDELKTFERELFNIYITIKYMREQECWFKNEHQCEATFKCPYINICYNNAVADVVAGETPPEFKRLFKKEK